MISKSSSHNIQGPDVPYAVPVNRIGNGGNPDNVPRKTATNCIYWYLLADHFML